MKLQEYQAKDILRTFGAPVPNGAVCRHPEEALQAAERMGGRVVVKAQVLVGGRGKAGGVKVAASPDEARAVAESILGMEIKALRVREVLVEPALDIAEEVYAGIVTDRAARRNAIIVSAAGGVDIEQVAEETPERIARVWVDPEIGLRDFQIRQVAFGAGLSDAARKGLPGLLHTLYRAFIEKDASLLEINPMVVTAEGSVVAADAKMVIDDNALYRQPDLPHAGENELDDPFELKAARRGINYVRLGGDIGTIGNGAGLAMANLDEVKRAGGNPANFLDIGGGAKADAVEDSLRLILSDPNVRGVMINIFGGITRADEVARGIAQAARNLRIAVPIVVRLTGTNEAEGRRILSEIGGVMAADSMADAARKIVRALDGRPA